jgi:hypothetical protein
MRSYSRSDADYVQKLVDKLSAEGFDIWIDNRIDTGTKCFRKLNGLFKAAALLSL